MFKKKRLIKWSKNKDFVEIDMYHKGSFDYVIETQKIETIENKISWLYHLVDKVWFTKEHVEQFLEMMFERQPI